jgi:hypothetical protein
VSMYCQVSVGEGFRMRVVMAALGFRSKQ